MSENDEAYRARRIAEIEAEIESEKAGEQLLQERAANVRARIEALTSQAESLRQE